MSRLHFALLVAYWCLVPTPTLSQIIPDRSLGVESSIVLPDTVNGMQSDRISGGAIRGINLFHSFQDFNIEEGRGAYFSNPTGILNILSRVTGTNPSNIFGTLGILGNANLFLLNPNGIVFGPNARLDLRGSFLASTADSLVLDHGFVFSSSNPQAPPLLTVNIPIGLQFRPNSSSIINQSTVTGQNLPLIFQILPISNQVGLAVDSGQTLALVGGDIQLNSGILTANTGQILLGSVASPGFVGFAPTPLGLTLNYDNIQTFGNIQLSNQALINTSGLGGGRVEIRGGNVNIGGAAGIFALTLGNLNGRDIDIRANSLQVGEGAQISTLTLASGGGGSINISTTDSVELSGTGAESFQQFLSQLIDTGTIEFSESNMALATGTNGTGKAGQITIETRRLLLQNGTRVGSVAVAAGRGGNITLRANSVEIVGSGISSGTIPGSTGNGGNISVEARQLTVRDGGALTALTLGQGASGNITIKADVSVEVLRSPDGAVFPTLINTTAVRGDGKAGDITIDTGRLVVSDGAIIDSSSGGFIGQSLISTEGGPGGNVTVRASESVQLSGISGNIVNRGQTVSSISALTTTKNNGGEVRISTPSLMLRDGAAITTASFLGEGNAGNITIDAQILEVIGGANNGQFVSRIQAFAGRIFGIPNAGDRGNAGSLTVNANRFMVRDGATITVESFTGGQAGTIAVLANAIALDNGSRIDATTVSGGGGNITLQAQDIQLRRGSRIRTDAGTSNGGQINIDSDTLVAFPRENSDITANATTGTGGRVTINVPNIFGAAGITREQIRDRLGLTDTQFAALPVNPTILLNTSDIAAISQAAGPSLQGTVAFSTAGVNPAQGLVELPQNVVDSTGLITANPCTQGENSEFTITGRGGVPPNPNDALSIESSRFVWVEPAVESRSREAGEQLSVSRKLSDRPFPIPARGWVMNAQGEVTLTAYNTSDRNPQRLRGLLSVCLPR